MRSGLGALPFFLVSPDKMDRKWVGAASAVASGVTLAASFGTTAANHSHSTMIQPPLRAGMIYEGVYSEEFDGHYLLVRSRLGNTRTKTVPSG